MLQAVMGVEANAEKAAVDGYRRRPDSRYIDPLGFKIPRQTDGGPRRFDVHRNDRSAESFVNARLISLTDCPVLPVYLFMWILNANDTPNFAQSEHQPLA